MTSFEQVLTQNDIIDEMDSTVQKLQSSLKIKCYQSRILLHKFKWDMDSLLDAFHESRNIKSFLKEHGAVLDITIPNTSKECSICCDERKLKSLNCQHKACKDCWKTYLTEQIKNGQSLIECVDYNCKLIIDTETLKRFLSISQLNSYQKQVVKGYVEYSPSLMFCPMSECNKILRKGTQTSGICSCGTRFCFGCLRDVHSPATCQQLRDWKAECDAHENTAQLPDKASNKWIRINTKECPRCYAFIQKNGGCMQMKCTNRKCNLGFCWNCLSPGYHHVHVCVPRKGTHVGPKIHGNSSFFYYYKGGLKDQQQKIQLEKAIFRKEVVEMYSWRKETCDLLSQCRHTLTYANIFGYYQENREGRYFRTFLKHRDALEIATEQLKTEFTNHYFWSSYHQEVNRKREDAEKCLKVFMKHCERDEKEFSGFREYMCVGALIFCAFVLLCWWFFFKF